MSLESQPTEKIYSMQPRRPLGSAQLPPPDAPSGLNRRPGLFSPVTIFVVALLILFGLAGYGLGLSMNKGAASPGTSMQMGDTSTATANYPKATSNAGNQPATFTVDQDGAKHFTFTAQNVEWQVLKGHWVDAYTLNGTVPGPEIHVIAGDHVRITITNQLDEPTTIHWHGLEVPSSQDGVPGLDQQPIQPGTNFTYDFTIQLDNYGTYVYHSHYDDVKQVGEGLYGAFIVDPKPGTAAAASEPKAQHDVLQILDEMEGYFTINGHSYPDTDVVHVKHGDTTRFRLINMGELIHPMHLHGHDFTVFAKDGGRLPAPETMNTLTIAPGETADFTFYAWGNPGDVYPFHCHILTHLMNPGQSMTQGMGGLTTLIMYDK